MYYSATSNQNCFSRFSIVFTFVQVMDCKYVWKLALCVAKWNGYMEPSLRYFCLEQAEEMDDI